MIPWHLPGNWTLPLVGLAFAFLERNWFKWPNSHPWKHQENPDTRCRFWTTVGKSLTLRPCPASQGQKMPKGESTTDMYTLLLKKGTEVTVSEFPFFCLFHDVYFPIIVCKTTNLFEVLLQMTVWEKMKPCACFHIMGSGPQKGQDMTSGGYVRPKEPTWFPWHSLQFFQVQALWIGGEGPVVCAKEPNLP